MEEPASDGTEELFVQHRTHHHTRNGEGARIWIQRKESDISNMAQLLDNHMSPRTNFSSPTLSTSLLKCRSLLPTFSLVPHQPG